MLPDKAIIAVIHLPALPGHPRCTQALDAILQRVRWEAALLCESGFDAIIVENFGDAPFAATQVQPHVVAAMTACVRAAVDACGHPVGVNVLRNDPLAALAVAAAAGGAFVRVNIHSGVYATDQGLIEGRADRTLQYRRQLGAAVHILADVHVKHAQPLSQPDIALAAEETAYRAGADALIVSGPATGRAADMNQLQRVKEAVPDRPVLLGSGVTPQTVRFCLQSCDGVIVGSCLREAGRAGADLVVQQVQTFTRSARAG